MPFINKLLKDRDMTHKKYAVFTMDVETFADTECIKSAGIAVDNDLMDGFDEYIKLMDRHGIKSTLFTIGELAPKIADRLKPCLANGHTLAMHSYTHVAPMSVPVEQFRKQTALAKEQMQKLFGVDVVGFRAPCFSMDKARLDVLQELGFRYDSSHLDFSPARHTVKLDLQDFQNLRNCVFRRSDFYEFGLAKNKVMGGALPVSGGGYTRLGPWVLQRPFIRDYIRKSDYYVFYLHPFELTQQKVPSVPRLNPFNRYYIKQGIRGYAKRIESIIQMLKHYGYEFVTFEHLTQLMEQEHPIG